MSKSRKHNDEKEHYDESHLIVVTDELTEDQQDEQDLLDDKILEASSDIRLRLLQYSDTQCYPLCEYLDLANVNNYVQYLLNK